MRPCIKEESKVGTDIIQDCQRHTAHVATSYIDKSYTDTTPKKKTGVQNEKKKRKKPPPAVIIQHHRAGTCEYPPSTG